MPRVILDAALLTKLHGLQQALELRDESGRVRAQLIPIPDLSQYEPVEPQLSAEELERRRQDPDYSTTEVLDYLEKL